jgi:hypothetical protein
MMRPVRMSTLLVVFWVTGCALADDLPFLVQETPIGAADVGGDVAQDRAQVSRDGLHLACVIVRGNRVCVAFDGVEGPFYEINAGQVRYGSVSIAAGPGVYPSDLQISDDGARFAYKIAKGLPRRDVAVVDGIEGPGYNSISQLHFGPGHPAHACYIGVRDREKFVVLDGVAFGPYDELLAPGLRFGPDGQHLASIVRKAGRTFVTFDGVPGRAYGHASDLVFSPDGRRIAYVAGKGTGAGAAAGGEGVVVDATELPQFRSIIKVGFSPEGSRVWYLASAGRGCAAVVDQQAGPVYEEIGPPAPSRAFPIVFSPDGRRVAYRARAEGGWRVVVDGQPEAGFTSILEGPEFSADGKTVAYVAKTEGKTVLVVNGTATPPYNSIQGLKFGPNGKHSACVARIAERGTDGRFVRRSTLLLDGREWGSYGFIDPKSLVFSDDGNHLAYVAARPAPAGEIPGPFFQVVDGQEAPVSGEDLTPCVFSPDSKHYAFWCSGRGNGGSVRGTVVALDGTTMPGGSPMRDSILFSPTSDHIAYVGQGQDGYFVVLDGAPGPAFGMVSRLRFSSDGRHFAYVGATGRFGRNPMYGGIISSSEQHQWAVALDGGIGPLYDGIVRNGPTFLPDGTLEYLAWRETTLYRVLYVPKVK